MAQLYTLTESDLRELNELHTGSLGVVRKDSATAMSNTSRVLVIGLGGMGLETVFKLKKMLIERVGELRPTDIQFLAIDTDRGDLQKKKDTGILTDDETVHLFNASIGATMKLPKELIPKAIKSILPPPSAMFNPTLDGNGANQVRLAGRLSLMDSDAYNKIFASIQTAIQNLRDFTTKTLEIHVVAGIGGGTGSGLCVDVPYLIRRVAASLNVPETNMRLFGHIYLPNVYKGTQGVTLEQAYHNGYAALKEIDYYMNIAEVGEEFRVSYPNGDYSCQKNIFDFCTLIGGQIAEAIVVENRKASAVATCVSSMTNEVTRVVSKNPIAGLDADASMADVFMAGSFRDNNQAALNVVLTTGQTQFPLSGNYKYTVIGASALKFPTEAIIEYYIGRTFHKTMEILRSNATTLRQEDIEAFARGALAPADLIRASLEKFDTAFDGYISSIKWTKQTVGDRGIDTEVSTIVTNIVKVFDEKGDMGDLAWTRIDQKANEIFKNAAKGPYYLARMLTDSTANAGLSGYFEKLDKYALTCAENIDRLNEAIRKNEAAKNEQIAKMQKAFFSPSKKDIDSFTECLKTIWADKLKVRLFTKLQTEYYIATGNRIGTCYQIRSRFEQKYLAKVDILTRVDELLSSSADIRKDELYTDQAEGSIFQLTDEEFDALKNSVRFDVNTQLNNFDDAAASAFATALLAGMADNPERWSLNSGRMYGQSECAKTLREFIYNYGAFASVTGKTFSSYFEDAYKNETPARQDAIALKIIRYMNTNASPMFNVFPTVTWGSLEQLKHTFMVIPSNMGNGWDERFQHHLSGRNQNIFLSPDQNAMYNYTMYACLPIWIHADIGEYEKYYNAITTAGVHINESEEMQPPYKDYPGLIPQSQFFRLNSGSIVYENPHEVEINTELSGLIEKALAYGILSLNKNGLYEIRRLKEHPSDEEMALFFKKYVDDPDHYDGNLLRGGEALMNAALAAFGTVTEHIAPAGRVIPNSESVLPELLRKQMRDFGILRTEVAYAEKTLFGSLEEINRGVAVKLQRKDIAMLMLYGLIDANDRGVWNYHLGERECAIISKLEVSTGAMSAMLPYMEMVVADTFFKLEKSTEHMILLKERVQAINMAILSGNYDMSLLKDRYAKFEESANSILVKFKAKLAMGDKLNATEQEVKAFYEQMLVDMAAVISTLS